MPVFRFKLLGFGLLLQTGLGLLGLALGHLGWRDPMQPLLPTSWGQAGVLVGWGLLATLPMLAYLLLFHYWKPEFYRPMREFMDRQLGPMIAASGWWELLVIAVTAGVGEELLFRWCLLGGAAASLEPACGGAVAFGIALAGVSLLFGVCHALNPIYFFVAFVAAAYLGVVMQGTGSWWAAAVAHFLFDFCALGYLKVMGSRTALSQDDPT